MAQRRRNLSGAALGKAGSYSLQIDGGDISTRLATLVPIYEEQKIEATRRLAQAGINRQAKILDETGTPAVGQGGAWGVARMAGRRNEVRFAAEGNSQGRNKSGKMIRALSYDIKANSNGVMKARFGWVFNFEEYFRLQDQGFTGFSAFDEEATRASGRAEFKSSRRTYFVQGANSLPQAIKLVDSIKQSFFAGAWNEAVRQWKKTGKRGNPGSYTSARNKYESYKNQGRV